MATFNKHYGNINIMATNIMATFNKHYGNIEQTLWQHLTNIMATWQH